MRSLRNKGYSCIPWEEDVGGCVALLALDLGASACGATGESFVKEAVEVGEGLVVEKSEQRHGRGEVYEARKNRECVVG